jgi:hypothetical protein
MARADPLVTLNPELDSAAVVRPGDTLVIGVDASDWADDRFEKLKADAEEHLPGVRVLIIDGARSMAVSRPAGAPPADSASVLPDDSSALTIATQALSEIREVTGTSTEAHHAARRALDEIGMLGGSLL